MKYAAVGTEFVAAVGLMVLAGVLMDRWLATLPLFTLVGLLVGFAAGIYRLVVAARNLGPKAPRDDESDDTP
jgi:ATP synthase protein I